MENYKAEIKQIPEHIVYYKDYFAANATEFLNLSQEDNCFQELSDRVMAENPGIELTEPDYNVLVYLDGDFRERDVRYRFCDAVTGLGKDCEEYKFTKVEPFTAVTVLHKGPYRKLGEAYAFAKEWMRIHGYVQTGSPRDSAIDGCWNRDSEEDYLTEIQIPVKEAAMKERMKLPKAELEHLFYIEVSLHKEEYNLGNVGRGDLVICPISGGRFEGEKLKGTVADFGADWNLMYANYLNCVDTRYLLKTDDGALISLSTIGRALIEKEQDDAMERGKFIDPADYYFRQHLLFETGDPRYQWLNAACCFAVIGIKDMQTIVYDAYMVK